MMMTYLIQCKESRKGKNMRVGNRKITRSIDSSFFQLFLCYPYNLICKKTNIKNDSTLLIIEEY